MRIIFISIIVYANLFNCFSQSGCSDPQAVNYNIGATINDGSCNYPYTTQTAILKCVLSNSITESSGLKWIDGKLYTFNDSGGNPDLFCIDTSNCNILYTIHITNYNNVDWEDMTADSNYIYVGDFGNNNGNRTDLKILKIDKNQLIGQTAFIRNVTAQTINFSYTDQTSFSVNPFNNFDCEALINVRDSLYIFTKNRGDNKTRAYKLPKTQGSYSVSPFCNYNTNGLITGADYNSFSNEIILIGYFITKTNSFLYYLNDFNTVNFFSGNKRRIEIGNNNIWQTEAITFLDTNNFFISCETAGNITSSIYRLNKNNIVLSNKINKDVENKITISYLNNGSVIINCTSEIKKCEVIAITGEITNSVNQTYLNENSIHLTSIDETSLKLIKLQLQDGTVITKKIVN